MIGLLSGTEIPRGISALSLYSWQLSDFSRQMSDVRFQFVRDTEGQRGRSDKVFLKLPKSRAVPWCSRLCSVMIPPETSALGLAFRRYRFPQPTAK